MRREFLLEETVCGQRLAIFEEGELCELKSDDPENEAGKIYLGRVDRIVKTLDAAFVDMGASHPGFLPLDDLPPHEKLCQGKNVLVQVRAVPGGEKGPRLTGKPTLAGRWIVLAPYGARSAVSQKISDENLRERLLAWATDQKQKTGLSVIMRTAAADASIEEIESEFCFLADLWREIEGRAKYNTSPCLLRGEKNPLTSALQRCAREDDIIIDGSALFKSAVERSPRGISVREHKGEFPLFQLYRVDAIAEKLMSRRQWLPCGGTIVVDETEALTVVDVNSARSTGRASQEESALGVNLEAADLIARVLRFRDIGGIVIIDFINMEEDESRALVLNRLRDRLLRDRAPVTVQGFTELGLLELTRKRSAISLTRRGSCDCPVCRGAGSIPAPEREAARILREIWYARRRGDARAYLIEGNDAVLEALREFDCRDEDVYFRRRTDALSCAIKGMARVEVPVDAFSWMKKG